MTYPKLTLISHHLCPYVQRAAITLLEKDVPFERRNIDLDNKPAWFLKLSPLGKVPILLVGDDTVLFESSVIAEYVNDLSGGTLLSADALERARQRAWMEFASQIIANVGRLYSAKTAAAFDETRRSINDKWQTLEATLGTGPWFAGHTFSLVDAAVAPAFRYFDVIEPLTDAGFFSDAPKVRRWREELSARASVQRAVSEDYGERLLRFLAKRDSVIGRLAQATLPGRTVAA